ncbi:tail-collar fiber protein [Kushneria sinocarnis]|uniref:Tail-collar fiber protein n=1 Tax=Kushneria sinocarnis TaxID=595502 RepID=A0A420WVL3_9GAMM|nr:phage tail protein [Kushneria sinocarnis]RKR02589.1 tail-collar fiber protein [Kushneria sinocarnis]
MAQYYTLPTAVGEAKLANAIALGGTITISELALGDGGGTLPTPDSDRTALINEVRRAQINTSVVDEDNPNWIVVEQVLPPDVGGWTIREVGLYDADGDMIAYGNYPETYKPQLSEGSGRTQTIRFVMQVSDTAAVTLKVDPTVVLATRSYVDDSIRAHAESRNHPEATTTAIGFVELATGTEAKARADKKRALTPDTGGQMLAAHEQAETAHDAGQIALAEALANFTDAETVQAVLALIQRAALLPTATTEQAQALSSDDVVLTPASLAAIFSGPGQTLGPKGCQPLPGGLYLQWSEVTVTGQVRTQNIGDASLIIYDESAYVTWSMKYPNACVLATGSFGDIGEGIIENMTCRGSQTGASVRANGLASRPAGTSYSISGTIYALGH